MIFITVILALITIGSFIFAKSLSKGDANNRYAAARKQLGKKVGMIVPMCTAFIFILCMLFSSMHIIDQTEVGVVRTFGQITGTLNSGMNFTNPFTDGVTIYDTKVHVKEIPFASYTKDAQAVDVMVEIQYELPRETISNVASQYGNYEALESKLSNVVEERIKVVLSRLTAMTLMETRSTLSTDSLIEVQGLQAVFPVKFTSVIVKDVSFSDAFEASVEAKMTAEQSALKAEQEKKTAIIQAEQAKEVSITQAEGRLAQSELDKKTAITNAEAEAEALRIKKEALSAMPEAYIEQLWIEQWDGKLPAYYGADGNLMLTPKIPE